MKWLATSAAFAAIALPLACNGSTGGSLLDFDAFASGPRDATLGQPYSFSTGRGYEVTLTRAKLHIGAVYLNESRPTSVSSDTNCALAGIYVAEVSGPVDVDVLDPTLQPFSVKGFATTDFAPTGEVWLSGGDINQPDDGTVILDVAGTASRAGESYPFVGTLTIGQNRAPAPTSPALPGSKPICKERVVSPVATAIKPVAGGRLVVEVDPRGWFANVDFEKLALSADGTTYQFQDNSGDQPSANLYKGVRSSEGVYSFSWMKP